MGLNLAMIKENAKVFGDKTPVFQATGVEYGTVTPEEYTYDEKYKSVKIPLEDGTFISARVLGDIDPAKDTLRLSQQIATRSTDASENYAAIEKGKLRDVAVAVQEAE